MAEPRRAIAFRGGGFTPRRRPWTPWIALIVILGAWHLATATGFIGALYLPSLPEIGRALADLFVSGKIVKHIGASLYRIGFGWTLGTLAGLAIGLAMGIFSLARAVGLPIVSALFPIPKIALLPLLILWLGIGEPSKVATIALGVFFPTVISAYTACDGVPRNLIRMGQSFGLPPAAIIAKILIPGAMPGILAGFRISASIALILVVAAEMIGAEFGIGAFILGAGHLNQSDQLMAGVFLLSILGLAIAALLGRVENWILRWR